MPEENLTIDEAISKVRETFEDLAFRTVENYERALESFEGFCEQKNCTVLTKELLREYNKEKFSSSDAINESIVMNKLRKVAGYSKKDIEWY